MTKLMFSLLVASLSACAGIAQETAGSTIQEALKSKNFIFSAESVTPQRGRMRQLTSEYDLRVRADSAVSFLPYFGRAFVAPITSEGGIKFTSTEFEYTFEKGKKNRWDVHLRPKDVSDIRDVYLTVFDNGRAQLRVNSLNRDPITFNGTVTAGRPLDRKAF